MAEPVIISYARGLLKEFPGVPEGVVDVIPVDLVVNATIAVAARGPANADGSPDVTQVASGGVNPLRYRRLVDLVHGWFTEHPVYDREGQPIVVPEWTFPGRGRVQGQLDAGEDGARPRPSGRCRLLPLRGKQADLSARIEEHKTDVERALTYVELYGAYVECEAVYGVDKLLALFESLPDDDQRAPSPFDPRVIDWDHYATADPPAVGRRARPRAHDAGPLGPARPASTGCGARCSTPPATSPPSTSRTRSSPRTSWRRTRGWRPAACRGTTASASC